MSFSFKVFFHTISLNFVNQWGAVMDAAQLYNALCQERLCGGDWHDMAMLRKIHGEEGLFIGAAPKDPEAYFKHFCLSIGVSPAAFAPEGRRQTKGAKIDFQLSKFMTKKVRGLTQNAIVSTMYRSRYCNITNDAPRFDMQPSDIELILKKCGDQYFDEVSRSASADLPMYKYPAVVPLVVTPNGLMNPYSFYPAASTSQLRPAKKESTLKKKPNKLTSVQLLRALRQALLDEELELGWDYLRLHRMCWTFFRELKEALSPDLTKLYGKDFIGHESFLPCIVFRIFHTASADKLAIEFQKTHNVKSSDTHLFEKTAEVLNDFIRRGQGAVCVEKMASGCGLQSKMVRIPVNADLEDYLRGFNFADLDDCFRRSNALDH